MQLTEQNCTPILEELVGKSGVMTAMLISKEGYNMVEAGDTSYLNTTALAALVAGMFSATREVANLVGEKQFSILLQQGENRHIHIGLIKDSVMMVLIFQDQQRIGKVRFEAQKAGEALVELMNKEEYPQQQQQAVETPEFKEYALHLIDMIFNKNE